MLVRSSDEGAEWVGCGEGFSPSPPGEGVWGGVFLANAWKYRFARAGATYRSAGTPYQTVPAHFKHWLPLPYVILFKRVNLRQHISSAGAKEY